MNMHEWFTLPKLAKCNLPGLPHTMQGLAYYAKCHNWKETRNGVGDWLARKASGTEGGGGWEYNYKLLPERARNDYIAHHMKRVLPKAGQNLEAWESYWRRSTKDQSEAERRLEVITFFRNVLNSNGYDKSMAVFKTSHHFKLSERTIYNWDNLIWGVARQDWLFALCPADRTNKRKGISKLDQWPEVADFIVAMIAAKPHVKNSTIHKALKAMFPSEQVPTLSCLQRWLATYKADNKVALTKMNNPDKHRSHYMSAMGSASERVTFLNGMWEFDSTPADIMLADNKRHNILGVIDVYSRRVKFFVSRTSTAAAVASLTRDTILDWGVPEIAKTDNGADYVSKHMVQVYSAFGIEQEVSPPFSPQKKPHIERVFKTLLHDIFELLPGYVGHNVTERQDIEARKSFAQRLYSKEATGSTVELALTPEELQAFLDKWVETIYHAQSHGGLNGKTPNQVAREWVGQPRRVDERGLDVLLMPLAQGGGLRRVGKQGVRADGATFIAAELAGYIGKDVMVKLDDKDWGAVFIFDPHSHEFICRAVDPMRISVDRLKVAAAAKKIEKDRHEREVKPLQKAAKKINSRDLISAILDKAAADAPNVTSLPKRATVHTTPQMDAAKVASDWDQVPANTSKITPEQRAEFVKQSQEKQAANVVPTPAKMQAGQMFKEASNLIKTIEAGQSDTIPADKMAWLESYRQTSDFIGRMKAVQSFATNGKKQGADNGPIPLRKS